MAIICMYINSKRGMTLNSVTLFSIALGVSMDAFAVAVTSGIIINKVKLKNALKIGFFFGFFQALMPLIGWGAGIGFHHYIEKFDHWIAFILLVIIGGKMIYESFKGDEGEEDKNKNPLQLKVLLFLAVATSIDALAVGISFAFLEIPIFSSIIIIGMVTFIFSFLGVLIGKSSGQFLRGKAEIVGGVVLTFIGVKILFDHLNISIPTIFQ